MKKPRTHTFKKGNPGGPGRPKLPGFVKAIRQMNQLVLAELLHKYTHMSIAELDQIYKHPDTPAFHLMVITAIKYAIQKNDTHSRNFLVDRMVGRVPVHLQGDLAFMHGGHIEHTHEVTMHERIVNLVEEIENKDK